MRSERGANAAILALFAALAAAGATYHAMFCDEVQAWMLARDSATPAAIFGNLYYEGHPALWYLLIWPLTRITWSPEAMKPLAFAISLGTVALFVWRGPFSRLEKLLWPLGYYVLFEYTIKSRSYGLGILLLALFCALWPNRRRHMVAIALVLGLMANTHVYFAVIAAGGAVALLVDRIAEEGWRGLFADLRRDIPAALILAALTLIAVLTAKPPASGDYAEPRPADVIYPLLAMGDAFWPMMRSYLEGGPPAWAIALELGGIGFVAILLLSSIVRARTAPPALAFLLVSLGGLLAFFFLGYPALVQHSGTLMVALTGGIWLQRLILPAAPRGNAAWRAILVTQAAAGLLTVGTHFVVPYSNGLAVADFVRAQGWADDPIAGVGPWFTTVCGYLRKPACFYADRHRSSGHLVQDGPTQAVNDRGPPDVAKLAVATEAIGRPVTFIATAWFDNPGAIATMARHGYRRVGVFTGADLENFTVFRRD